MNYLFSIFFLASVAACGGATADDGNGGSGGSAANGAGQGGASRAGGGSGGSRSGAGEGGAGNASAGQAGGAGGSLAGQGVAGGKSSAGQGGVAGQGGAGNAGAGQGGAAADFITHFAQTYCAGLDACCQRLGDSFSTDKCESDVIAAVDSFPVAIANGDAFDPDAAATCLNAITNSEASCTEAPVAALFNGDVCRPVFQGGKTNGQACEVNFDCVQPLVCGLGASGGSCEVDPSLADPSPDHGKAGDACGQTCDADGGTCQGSFVGPGAAPKGAVTCYLSEGLACDVTTWACVAAPPQGAPCAVTGACALGAFCDSESQGCRASIAANGPCDPTLNGELATNCAKGLYCEPTTSTCAALIADGGACTQAEQCAGRRCLAKQCVDASELVNAPLCAGDFGG